MDNTKNIEELKVITCKEKDKTTFQAICFIKKMKQHELLSHLINKEVENSSKETKEAIKHLKKGM
jgi:hypothetical protein